MIRFVGGKGQPYLVSYLQAGLAALEMKMDSGPITPKQCKAFTPIQKTQRLLARQQGNVAIVIASRLAQLPLKHPDIDT